MTTLMRTTSIRFKYDNEMCRAFSQLGLNLRCEDHDTNYWDGYTFVYDSIAKALERHDIKCEVSYEWYTKE